MELDVVSKLITFVGAIFGIALTISHLLAQKSTGKLKKFDIFKEIKTYLDDSPDKNFSAICVAINCICKRELTLQEVKWFILTPHAFDYLKAYSDQERYIELSENMDSFRYSGKYQSETVRNIEYLVLVLAYIILASIGVSICIFTQSKVETFIMSISGYIFGIIFIIFGVMALIQKGHLSSSKSTVKRKFCSVMPNEQD
ncbi:hypothetical protein [Shewanella sp. T24-MNA-CIBAN-0130]|uniref:hypothetical protein n=1 Tax=Shewanella sp. T24-MNA-CIBAN-0130 TaxID=3140470 RepID=UPI00332BFFDE